MTKLQTRQLKFLLETAVHYNCNNRGFNAERRMCSYSDGCAIGRHLSKNLCKVLDLIKNSSVDSQKVFAKLPNKLKTLKVGFLSDIQDLHDTPIYWDETGLSEAGFKRLKRIQSRIINGEYSVMA